MTERDNSTPAPVQQLMGATDAERLEDLRLAAAAIRTYMPDTLPTGEDGKIHFARALAEAAAEAIEGFLSAADVTNHGSKSDLHPEYVTSEAGTKSGYKGDLYPGNVPAGEAE